MCLLIILGPATHTPSQFFFLVVKGYRDSLQKRNAWKEVAERAGIEESLAVGRYTTIRTRFSKYLKERKGDVLTLVDDNND